jgi:hypothetical protein
MSENQGIVIHLSDTHMPAMSELTPVSISQKRKLTRFDLTAPTHFKL